MKRFLVLLALLGGGAIATAAAAPPPRILLIGIDAIPYSVAARVTDRARGGDALFRGMKGPAAVINTFPTASHVAWSGLLEPFGVSLPLGYEARYFDRHTRRARGGYSLAEGDAGWKDFFDWRLDGIVRGAIAYGWPESHAVQELEDALDAFRRSDKFFFSIYIISTDGIAHILGPDALERFLKSLDAELEAFRRANPQMPFYTVMVSDHGAAGGAPLTNSWPAVSAALENAGFRVVGRLSGDADAAPIAFGLLNGFVIYTARSRESAAARAAAAAEGVELCAFADGEGWEVADRAGRALIRRRAGGAQTHWSYRPLRGDPLDLQQVVAALRRRAGAADAQWFSDEKWFEATAGHVYPDALYRIARSFDLVANPASVVCSVAPGYMFGARLTQYTAKLTIGALRWTHGSIRRDASLGFLMTDIPGWIPPAAVRFNQALAPLAPLVRAARERTVSARSSAADASAPGLRPEERQ